MVYWVLVVASTSTFVGSVLLAPTVLDRNLAPVEILLNASIYFAAAIPAIWLLGKVWNYPLRQAGALSKAPDDTDRAIFRPKRFLRFFEISYSLLILLMLATIIIAAEYSLISEFTPMLAEDTLFSGDLTFYVLALLLLVSAVVLKIFEIMLNWPPPWVTYFKGKPRDI